MTQPKSKDMPFHWRHWLESEKLDWCKVSLNAVDSDMTPSELAKQINDAVGESGVETIDNTPLHTLAAFIVVMS